MMTKHEVTWREIMEYGDCAECGGEGSRERDVSTGDAIEAVRTECSECRGTGRADWTPEMTAEAMLLCEWHANQWHPGMPWSPEGFTLEARNETVRQVARAFAVGQCQANVAREAFQALLGVES